MHVPPGFTPEQLEYWRNADGLRSAEPIVMHAPDGMDECVDCIAIDTVTSGGDRVVRVPWLASEADIAKLAAGGTLWLSTWGGLPPHQLEVQAP